jgi:hypothetical protein
MATLKSKLQESSESKEARKNDKFATNAFKSLDFPIVDDAGYSIGVFTGFEIQEPSGEIRTSKKGNVWADKRSQIKFSFTVPTESGRELTLNFWTGTCIDGVRDELGRLSKLSTWFVAIGAIDEKSLHPKFKVDEESLMNVIRECFEKKFRFKTEMKGRIHVPIIDTFELVDSE